MRANKSPGVLRLSIVLLSLLPAAAAFAADGSFEWRGSVSEPLVLDVDTGSGAIHIRSGAVNEVEVTGEITVSRRFFLARPANADELVQQVKDEPPIELSGGRLKVGYFNDRKLARRVSISYEIVVPATTEIIAESGSGAISVRDIAGPVDVNTGSGSVTLDDISSAVKARTGSGSIRAERVGGGFEGSSGSGSIYLSQTAPGDVTVSTGSGASELTGVAGAVRVSAGSGRITIDGRQEGDWDLQAGSGTIRVTLPADAAFDLDAESSSGGIDIDHPLTVEGRISHRHIVGQVRGGGPLLKIDTGSGGIRIR